LATESELRTSEAPYLLVVLRIKGPGDERSVTSAAHVEEQS